MGRRRQSLHGVNGPVGDDCDDHDDCGGLMILDDLMVPDLTMPEGAYVAVG